MTSRSSSPEFSPLAIGVDLTPLPEYKAAGETALDFDGLLETPLHLHEDLAGGCGGQTWPAGVVLATHMLRYHREKLRQSRILEIGAGGGLVGLAVAKGCSLTHPLYLTDQEEMLSLMKHNSALNNVEDKVEALILNWGEPLPSAITAFKPDVILAADCVYFEPAFPLLLQTLTDLLFLCPSATVYFCFKKRRRADMQFLKNAKKTFVVTEVEDQDREVFGKQQLFLLTITRKE